MAAKFPIKYKFFGGGQPMIRAKFFGKSYVHWKIDTGCPSDAALETKQSKEFNEQIAGHFYFFLNHSNPTNEVGIAPARAQDWMIPEVKFNGESCTNFNWCIGPGENIIGLRFLSRYLTTLNFPEHTMLLQPNTNGLPASIYDITNYTKNLPGRSPHFIEEAANYLKHLVETDCLPGCGKGDTGTLTYNWNANKNEFTNAMPQGTFLATKPKDNFRYHYTVAETGTNRFKLEKAWRTDAKGHVVETYSIP